MVCQAFTFMIERPYRNNLFVVPIVYHAYTRYICVYMLLFIGTGDA